MDFGLYINDKPAGLDSNATHPDSAAHTYLRGAADLAAEVWNSAQYSFKQPLLGVAEIADHTTGTTISKNHWLSEKNTDDPVFNSPKFWAQQVGGTLGSMPWFTALSKVVGSSFKSAIGPGVLESATTSQLQKIAILESMTTGFAYGTLLRPSRLKDDQTLTEFAENRLLTGATTAGTFGFSAFVSGRINAALGEKPPAAEKIAASFTSSALSGGVDAEIGALRKHGRLATGKELSESMFTWAVVGGGMTAVQEAIPFFKSKVLKERDASKLPDEKTAREALSKLSNIVENAAAHGDKEAAILHFDSPLTPNAIPPLHFKQEAFVNNRPVANESIGAAEAPIRPSVGVMENLARVITPPVEPTPVLTGASKIVFDRLTDAGLHPSVHTTTGGAADITIPLASWNTSPNALSTRAFHALELGVKEHLKDAPEKQN